MKKITIEETRAKIRQLRLEANNPAAKEERIRQEEEKAARHAAIAKDKLEKWMMMKILKGEWNNDFRKNPIDIDDWARKCSVKGHVSK